MLVAAVVGATDIQRIIVGNVVQGVIARGTALSRQPTAKLWQRQLGPQASNDDSLCLEYFGTNLAYIDAILLRGYLQQHVERHSDIKTAFWFMVCGRILLGILPAK